MAFLNSNGTYEKHMTKLWLRKFEIGLERGVSLGGLEEMWCPPWKRVRRRGSDEGSSGSVLIIYNT